MSSNETEFRAEVVDQWLHAAGFTGAEIEREVAFSFILGKTTKSTTYADYLITRSGEPLFVIEVKRVSHTLLPEDCQQALSYARQAGAPITVVTNGRESLLFRSWNGERIEREDARIDGAFWGRGNAYTGLDDLEMRLAALADLISLNEENLNSFCAAQIDEATKHLRRGELAKTFGFDPQLHVRRPKFVQEFEAFLAGSDPIFVVCGVSGSGKSDSLIHAAHCHLSDAFALYIPVGSSKRPLLSAIASQFNFAFTEQRSRITLMKTLARIARDSGRRLILFIDDVDLVEPADLSADLETLAAFAEQSGTDLRLVLGAQPHTWKRLCRDGPSPSALATRAVTVSDREGIPLPNVVLGRFESSEFEEAVEKLAAIFGTTGVPNQTFATFPVIARLLFSAHRGRAVPVKPSPSLIGNLLSQWMSQRFEAVDPIPALREIAELSVQRHHEKHRRERPLISLAQLSFDHQTAARLSDLGLAEHSSDEHGRHNIVIAEQWLEDYIIAFHLCAWDRASVEDLRSQRSEIEENPLLSAAANWAAEVLTREQRSALVEPVVEAAVAYGDALTRLLEPIPCCSPQFPRTKALPVLHPDPSFLSPSVFVTIRESREHLYIWSDEFDPETSAGYTRDTDAWWSPTFLGRSAGIKRARKETQELLLQCRNAPPEPLWIKEVALESVLALVQAHVKDLELTGQDRVAPRTVREAIYRLRSREFHAARIGHERTGVERDVGEYRIVSFTHAPADDPEVSTAVAEDVKETTLRGDGPDWTNLLLNALNEVDVNANESLPRRGMPDRRWFLDLDWPLDQNTREFLRNHIHRILQTAIGAFPAYAEKCITVPQMLPDIHQECTQIWFELGPKQPWKESPFRRARYVVSYAMAVLSAPKPGVQISFLNSWDESMVRRVATSELELEEGFSFPVGCRARPDALAAFFCPTNVIGGYDHGMKGAEKFAPIRNLLFWWLRAALPRRVEDIEAFIDVEEKR